MNKHSADSESPSPQIVPSEPSFVKTEKPAVTNHYYFPPVSMLQSSKCIQDNEIVKEIQIIARILVQILKSFGVQTTFIGYSRGPTITRYELQPAVGVKISKITNLTKDLSMYLEVPDLRVVGPISGKAAVGIEIPNRTVEIVRMRELIESNIFVRAKSPLTVALGRDMAGEIAIADLAKMPHLLIAGSTGSGKSVCINSFIISLLYKALPDEVRFLMIDPKAVQLSIYNGIPHLLVPVITDPRRAAGALCWAISEMLKRYKIFEQYSVRNLIDYNQMASCKGAVAIDGIGLQWMPNVIIIIDGLSELMESAPDGIEDSLYQLARMGRAAGIHLLISTQRPAPDIISGSIKMNIPSRIAFAVPSHADSRMILDASGAEKLRGRGDMLFSPIGSQVPIRIQGCFISDSEIESVVGFVKQAQESGYDQNIVEEIERDIGSAKDNFGDNDRDPMMAEAIKCVVEAGQASTSLLQRRMRLGYARAGQLIDKMEQMGIVGPHEGSSPRQVLISYQQWLEMSMHQNEYE